MYVLEITHVIAIVEIFKTNLLDILIINKMYKEALDNIKIPQNYINLEGEAHKTLSG